MRPETHHNSADQNEDSGEDQYDCGDSGARQGETEIGRPDAIPHEIVEGGSRSSVFDDPNRRSLGYSTDEDQYSREQRDRVGGRSVLSRQLLILQSESSVSAEK